MEIFAFIIPLILVASVLYLNPQKDRGAYKSPLRKRMAGATISWTVGIILLYNYFSENYTMDGWHTEFVYSLLFLLVMSSLGGFVSLLIYKRAEEAGTGRTNTSVMNWAASLGSFFKIYLHVVKFTFIFNLIILIISFNSRNTGIFNTIYYIYAAAPKSLLIILSLFMALPIAIYRVKTQSTQLPAGDAKR